MHLRLGFIGELRLANRIARALKGEVVVSYGLPAGRQGPDVISVGPDGTIRVWDSKWRTRTMRITSGAHEKEQSLALAATEVERQVEAAITAGRLTPEAAAKAAENAAKGNFFVITVGTGNAHGGMVTAVEGRKFVLDPRKK